MKREVRKDGKIRLLPGKNKKIVNVISHQEHSVVVCVPEREHEYVEQ